MHCRLGREVVRGPVFRHEGRGPFCHHPSSLARERQLPAVNPDATVRECSERWLALCAGLKPRTVQGYQQKLARHILPALGSFKIRRLHRGAINTLLAEEQATDLSVESVRLTHATLRAMLNAAVEDDLIRTNPAAALDATSHFPSRTARAHQRPRPRAARSLPRGGKDEET